MQCKAQCLCLRVRRYGPTWIACTLWLMIAVVAQLTREFNCEKGSTDKACQSGWMGPVVAGMSDRNATD